VKKLHRLEQKVFVREVKANMSDQQTNKRPKCKVVRRMHDKHNGLARIHPKGCRIAKRVLTKDGRIRKVNKAGKFKPVKMKYKARKKTFYVHALMPDGSIAKLVWDSGATSTSLNHAVAKKLGLIDSNGLPTNTYPHSAVNVMTADESKHKAVQFRNVPLKIREAKGVIAKGDAIVWKRASLLFGVTHMRAVRKHMSVKFVD